MPRCHVADRRPKLGDPVAREPVVDAVAVPSRLRQPRPRQQPQMMRGCCEALTNLDGDLLDRPLALCKNVRDLRAPPAPERGRDRCECIEQRGLGGSLAHIIKLMFEY